jgi:hypothetical protein
MNEGLLINVPLATMHNGNLEANYQEEIFVNPCRQINFPTNGLPIAWLAQTAFQMIGDKIDLLRKGFCNIQNETNKFP